MAVKITVYGRADMSQITRARAELDALERKALSSSNRFMGAMASIADSTKRVGTSLANTGDTMTRNLTVPILAMGAGLAKATQNAANDAKAQVILAGALRNNAGATDAVIKSTEDWITAQGKLYGVADDNLRPALSTLVGATKDVQKAQILAGLAMDISAARGVDVETAAKAVGKAYAGQTSQLTKLVPGIDAAAVKAKDFAGIYRSVNSIVGGQAAAASNTAAGAMQRNKIAFDEATESLGYAFMPIMKEFAQIVQRDVVPAVQRMADWFAKLTTGQKNMIVGTALVVAALGPLLSITGRAITGISSLANGMFWVGKQAIAAGGGLMNLWTGMTNAAAGSSAFATPMMRLGGYIRTAATATWGFITSIWASITATAASIGTRIAETAALVASKIAQAASTAATVAMTAAQWALNAAMTANPIGIVVVAIAALVGALVWLWNTNDGFRNALIGAWNAIKNAAVAVWNGVVAAVKWAGKAMVDVFLNWSLLGVIIKNWNNIKLFFTNLPKWMQTIGKQIVDGLLNGIQNAWSSLTGWLGNAVDGVVNSVKNALGIKSPSRVFKEIGKNVGDGMADGIADKIPHVANVSADMARAAAKAAKETAIRRYTSAWEARYTGVNPAADQSGIFEGLIPKKDKVEKKVDAAAKALAEKIKSGADLAKQAMKAWSMDEVVGKVTTSFDKMLSGIQSQIQATADFMNNIASLKSRGLSATAVTAILGMGAAQGGGFASSLAGASDAQLKQYNAAYAEQTRLTGILGQEQSGAKNVSTVHIAPGAIQVSVGDNADKATVTSAMSDAIDKLVRELRSA